MKAIEGVFPYKGLGDAMLKVNISLYMIDCIKRGGSGPMGWISHLLR